MGTTIHYEGIAERENVVKILRIVEDYARSLFQIGARSLRHVIMAPYDRLHFSCAELITVRIIKPETHTAPAFDGTDSDIMEICLWCSSLFKPPCKLVELTNEKRSITKTAAV